MAGTHRHDAGAAPGFEVWLIDQSNSLGKTYGGAIYIYDGSDLNGNDASSVTPTDVLDLGEETAALCLDQTSANPVRPHMLAFNATHSHAILTFVASGQVVVFDAATRTPVACIRTTAGAGGQQAHAAQPTPDDAYILVANQNGKRVDRIATDYATNTFVLDDTLDLANGVTPNGVLREFEERSDNAPIRTWRHSGDSGRQRRSAQESGSHQQHRRGRSGARRCTRHSRAPAVKPGSLESVRSRRRARTANHGPRRAPTSVCRHEAGLG